MRQAVNRSIIRKIKALRRSNFFQKEEIDPVADKLVALIREAAHSEPFGHYIGRNCMVVSMVREPRNGFLAKYYPENESPYQYAPSLITSPGVALRGIEIWRGKGPPPWRRRS